MRDQIKSWIGSSDVKDKDPLIDARRLIETKMEAFKYCEKETKTKTYSKEGLAKAEKLTPEEEAKKATSEWIAEIIEKLTEMVEERDLEVERLGAGRGKKTNKNLIDECNHFLAMHKFHLTKLEGIMRLVNNDVLNVEVVDPIKEDLDYYIESYEDDDYQQAYDEDFFYEALGLDELQVVNVDRVTQASAEKEKNSKKSDPYSDLASSSSKGSEKGSKKSKKGSSASSMIPLTIGRARKGKKSARSTSSGSAKGSISSSALSHGHDASGNSGDDDSTHGNTPTKGGGRRGASGLGVPTPTTIPANTSAGTSSMAAMLKRETEAQEKERQQKVGAAILIHFCLGCVWLCVCVCLFACIVVAFVLRWLPLCSHLLSFSIFPHRPRNNFASNNSSSSSSSNNNKRRSGPSSNSKPSSCASNKKPSFDSNRPRLLPSKRCSRNNSSKPHKRHRCANNRKPRCASNNCSSSSRPLPSNNNNNSNSNPTTGLPRATSRTHPREAPLAASTSSRV